MTTCDPKTALVLLDVETMGLEPESPIVEVAMLLVDKDLVQIATWAQVVGTRPAVWSRACSGWALDAHLANGLYADSCAVDALGCARAASLFEVTRGAIAQLRSWGFAPGQAVICGESIHQDRVWIREQMPQLHEFLDYQMVDVTSLLLLAERFYGPLSLESNLDEVKGKSRHRALDDCRRTLRELDVYRQHLLTPTFRMSRTGGSERW